MCRGGLILGLGMGLLCACGAEQAAPAASAEGSEEAVLRPRLEVVTLEATSFDDEFVLVGETYPLRQALVTPELGGRITRFGLERSQHVTAGEVAMVVDTSQQAAQIAQIEAQIAGIETELERNERLMQRGLGTEATRDQLENQREVLEESIASIRTVTRTATTRVPIDGIVVETMVESGEFAAPGAPVARIVDLSKVIAVVGVPEREIGFVRRGLEVPVEFPSIGVSTTGIVVRMAAEGNPSNRTFATEVHVDNAAGLLRAGLRVRATFPRDHIDDALLVPRDAIIQGLVGPEAVVVRDGVVEVRTLTTGPGRAGYVVVTSGLAPGDRLAVRGHRDVVNGELVDTSELGACCGTQFHTVVDGPDAAARP